MDKKHEKIIKNILIFLGIIGLIGLSLFIESQFIFCPPLMIAGLVVGGIGFVPFVIISIILFIKYAYINY